MMPDAGFAARFFIFSDAASPCALMININVTKYKKIILLDSFIFAS
jgi:hypothetical protein